MSNAGIASATGTRLDSAAKHTMPCKIDDTLLITWFEEKNNARVALHVNKMKYAVQKDELVLNVTQKLRTNTLGTRAYPSVVSSLTEMPSYVRHALVYLYNSETAHHFLVAAQHPMFGDESTPPLASPQVILAKTMWSDMPYFTAQGYALGTAYASAQSGDTVSTVLVGGMVTVRNGGFSCRAGEPIMWYFDFEENMFHSKRSIRAVESERVDDPANADPRAKETTEQSRKRRMTDIYDTASVGHHKTGIALPKPYVLKRGRDHFGDKIRIFAKCINGGRPYDMIDIMLMTQSM